MEIIEEYKMKKEQKKDKEGEKRKMKRVGKREVTEGGRERIKRVVLEMIKYERVKYRDCTAEKVRIGRKVRRVQSVFFKN